MLPPLPVKIPSFILCDIFASTAEPKWRSLSTCLTPDKKTNQKPNMDGANLFAVFQIKAK